MQGERTMHVPYIRIDAGHHDAGADDTRIAAALNARLELNDGAKIPFVLPRGMAANNNDDNMASKRIVLFGAGGCGKTRCLFEMLKSRPSRKVCIITIINPKGLTEDAKSRRVAHLSEILDRKECGDDDGYCAIVWDNFPEGLEQQSARSVRLAIKMLGSCRKKRVYVGLSSRQQFEKAGQDMMMTTTTMSWPGFRTLRLKHEPADINKFLSAFGSGIPSLKQVFGDSIKPVLGEVSSILWRLEPTPRIVLDYLGKAHSERCATPADALALAKSFFGRSAYYEHQFAALKSIKGRRGDIEFVYTLKLCYELGMDRKMESIARLQKEIFGTKPGPRILSEFQLGLYKRGDQISIHDMAKDSFPIEEEAARKMISFIAEYGDDDDNNSDSNNHQGRAIIPCGKDDNKAYLLGAFVGRNSSLARKSDLIRMLPGRRMKGLLGNRFYQVGLGHGIGKTMDSLDAPMRRRVFKSAKTNNQFSKNLGEGIGWEMMMRRASSSLSSAATEEEGGGANNRPSAAHNSRRGIIFNHAKRNLIFSRGLGIGIGMALPRLPPKVKRDVFIQAERNVQLADGLGIGASSIIEFIPEEEHLWLFRTAEHNGEFARGVGTGLGQSFATLAPSIQSYALALLSQNPQFARGLGMGFGEVFEYLHEDLKKMAAEIAQRNPEFARGLGIGTGYSFSYFTSGLQKRIMEVFSTQNPSFAQGMGLGIGFTYYYLDQKMRDRMLEKAQADVRLAVGLGEGYGRSFGVLPAHLQRRVLSMVEANPDISLGFGMGTGYGFDYLASREKKEFSKMALENRKFARGLGYGLGRTFMFHDGGLRKAILAKMVLESEFAFGMGEGIGIGFSYIVYGGGEAKEKFFEMAATNAEFAEGLGTGLATVFSYFQEELQEKIAGHIRGNAALMKGMKTGFEQVWQYLDDGHRKFASDFCRR